MKRVTWLSERRSARKFRAGGRVLLSSTCGSVRESFPVLRILRGVVLLPAVPVRAGRSVRFLWRLSLFAPVHLQNLFLSDLVLVIVLPYVILLLLTFKSLPEFPYDCPVRGTPVPLAFDIDHFDRPEPGCVRDVCELIEREQLVSSGDFEPDVVHLPSLREQAEREPCDCCVE